MSQAPALRKGERIRLDRDGPLYEIARVSPTAAYPFRVYDPPRVETFTDKQGQLHTIKVSRGPVEAGISTRAFVYREQEQEEKP